jgi:hypothetical protein
VCIHHCTTFSTKHHYGLCWYEYPWCAIKFLYVLKHYKRFNSPFSAKVPFCHKHSCRNFLLRGIEDFDYFHPLKIQRDFLNLTYLVASLGSVNNHNHVLLYHRMTHGLLNALYSAGDDNTNSFSILTTSDPV